MRIAVVWSGISGLSAAFLLAPHAQVTLFEKSPQLGGHAHTASVAFGNTTVAVDTGFMVYNPARYPYFVALLSELNVTSIDTVMSFSATIPGQVMYSSDFQGLLGDVRQCTSPRYLRFLYDIMRFNIAAKKFLHQPQKEQLLGDFLQGHHFSPELASWYLYPIMASIWSAGTSALPNYPAYETFRFLNNHQLLNIFTKPQWRTIKGGSITYVEALSKKITAEGVQVRLNTPVTSIKRGADTVHITTAKGSEEFDHVIIATHADEALGVLGDATAAERDILGGFSYSNNHVILHSDTSFMPPQKRTWASWNYLGEGDSQTVSLTYDMNALQHIPEECPMFVTLNPVRLPKKELTHQTFTYAHPVFNAQARTAQERMAEIQQGRTHFSGAHLGFGFHEDGIASAVDVVQALGFPIRLSV